MGQASDANLEEVEELTRRNYKSLMDEQSKYKQNKPSTFKEFHNLLLLRERSSVARSVLFAMHQDTEISAKSSASTARIAMMGYSHSKDITHSNWKNIKVNDPGRRQRAVDFSNSEYEWQCNHLADWIEYSFEHDNLWEAYDTEKFREFGVRR